MAKKSVREKNKNNIYREGFKEKFTEALELPKELILDLPKLTIVGNRDMMIENYKGIIEYGSGQIRVNTGLGVIKITGAGLQIKEITSEDIILSGEIYTLEYVNAG